MIIGIGSDISDVRRIAKVIERHGERFLDRIFTDDRARQGGQAAQPRRDLRQALRRQGGLRQGARYRLARRRVVARHGRRQSAVGAADACSSPAARKRRLEAITPAGYEARIDLTITDEGPMAQAFVVISAIAGGPPVRHGSGHLCRKAWRARRRARRR